LENVIELNHVSVYYDNVCALSDINLSVKNKDFIGIIGPNGGGKSTLLKIILGLLQPTSGNVSVCGSSPGKASGKLAYVPQFSRFNRKFPINVRDVVLMGRLQQNAAFFHRFNIDDIRIAEKIMCELDIYDLRDRQIAQLSGGQVQRVLIARALAIQPQVMLLDEPTASLDSHSRTQIYSILKDLNKTMTILLVSHDMGVISSHVKSLACLNNTLYYHGEPELTSAILEKTFGCPVEIIAHGIPHRVLQEHREERDNA